MWPLVFLYGFGAGGLFLGGFGAIAMTSMILEGLATVLFFLMVSMAICATILLAATIMISCWCCRGRSRGQAMGQDGQFPLLAPSPLQPHQQISPPEEEIGEDSDHGLPGQLRRSLSGLEIMMPPTSEDLGTVASTNLEDDEQAPPPPRNPNFKQTTNGGSSEDSNGSAHHRKRDYVEPSELPDTYKTFQSSWSQEKIILLLAIVLGTGGLTVDLWMPLVMVKTPVETFHEANSEIEASDSDLIASGFQYVMESSYYFLNVTAELVNGYFLEDFESIAFQSFLDI